MLQTETSPRQTFTLSEVRERPFRIVNIDIKIDSIPAAFKGYRIIQLTDLHFGQATSLKHITKAVKIVQELNPKLILLTGDYVQYCATGIQHKIATAFSPNSTRWLNYRRKVRELTQTLSTAMEPLTPEDGLIGVFGNHDHLEGLGTIIRKLPQKILWLNNTATSIIRDGKSLVVAGIDDLRRGKPSLERTIEAAFIKSNVRAAIASEHSTNGYHPRQTDDSHKPVLKILLSHNPDVMLLPDKHLLSEMDLILCGHTHGGQICLPGIGPIITRTKQRQFVAGLHTQQNPAIYISHGVGYGGLPLRVLCPPEITVINLL